MEFVCCFKFVFVFPSDCGIELTVSTSDTASAHSRDPSMRLGHTSDSPHSEQWGERLVHT